MDANTKAAFTSLIHMRGHRGDAGAGFRKKKRQRTTKTGDLRHPRRDAGPAREAVTRHNGRGLQGHRGATAPQVPCFRRLLAQMLGIARRAAYRSLNPYRRRAGAPTLRTQPHRFRVNSHLARYSRVLQPPTRKKPQAVSANCVSVFHLLLRGEPAPANLDGCQLIGMFWPAITFANSAPS